MIIDENYIIKNEYWEKYLELCKNETFEITHKHHILPKAYFKLINQPVDNSINNIVRLTPISHALAHYYLALCTKGELMYKMRSCFIRMTGNTRFTKELNMTELEKLNDIKKEFGIERSRRMTGVKLSEERKLEISNNSKQMWSDEEFKENMCKKNKERWANMSEEQRLAIGAKISKTKKGTKCNYNTAESNKKISETLKDHEVSDETRQKISETLKGHKVSEETRQKISQAGKGRIPWNKGLKKTKN